MVVVLPRELTIAAAEALRLTLLEALAAATEVGLDATVVEDVDAAGLQLLCAAGRSARRAGGRLGFVPGRRSCALAEALALAGLGRDEADRWLVEEAAHG